MRFKTILATLCWLMATSSNANDATKIASILLSVKDELTSKKLGYKIYVKKISKSPTSTEIITYSQSTYKFNKITITITPRDSGYDYKTEIAPFEPNKNELMEYSKRDYSKPEIVHNIEASAIEVAQTILNTAPHLTSKSIGTSPPITAIFKGPKHRPFQEIAIVGRHTDGILDIASFVLFLATAEPNNECINTDWHIFMPVENVSYAYVHRLRLIAQARLCEVGKGSDSVHCVEEPEGIDRPACCEITR